MHIPFRIDYARSKKYPALVNAANAQGLPRAGNTNMPAYLSTQAAKWSERIRLNKGKPGINYRKRNYFKQWAGGPNGYGRRISNQF